MLEQYVHDSRLTCHFSRDSTITLTRTGAGQLSAAATTLCFRSVTLDRSTTRLHSLQKGAAHVVVRDVFQLKFGKAREAVAVMKEGVAIHTRLATEGSARLLTDVTGRHYTLVLEMTLPFSPHSKPWCPRSLATRSFRRTTKRWCRWWSPATARFSRSLSKTG